MNLDLPDTSSTPSLLGRVVPAKISLRVTAEHQNAQRGSLQVSGVCDPMPVPRPAQRGLPESWPSGQPGAGSSSGFVGRGQALVSTGAECFPLAWVQKCLSSQKCPLVCLWPSFVFLAEICVEQESRMPEAAARAAWGLSDLAGSEFLTLQTSALSRPKSKKRSVYRAYLSAADWTLHGAGRGGSQAEIVRRVPRGVWGLASLGSSSLAQKESLGVPPSAVRARHRGHGQTPVPMVPLWSSLCLVGGLRTREVLGEPGG